MGNDGGSIPKRRELVKSAARLPSVSELKATALESLGHAWTHCAVSGEKLDLDNAVSDWRGRLYNYESILRGLVPSDDASDEAIDRAQRLADARITSLRDIVKLKVKKYTPPPESSKNNATSGAKAGEIWACPVSLKELGPATKAVYIVPCGHVFAEIATREVQDRVCPECSEPFEPDNIVPLLSREDAELERLRRRMEDLKARGLSHNLKKDKSGGKKKRKAAGEEKEKGERENGEADGGASKEKDNSRRDNGKTGNINNAMTASLTARVLAEQEERSKRRKLAAVR